MKNIFALMLLLPICSALSGKENLPFTTTNVDSLNINRSFIHTQTMLSPNADSMLQEFQYFDGLGKPVQTVSQGISPAKGDLVSTSTYDSMGRISKQWLPLHVLGNNGAFLSDPFNSTVKQYADNAPYQYTEYDHLPESRIILQQDAGEAWKKNPVLIHYLTNESNTVLNCIRYQVNDKGTLYEDGVYDPGELRVIQSTDEDGKSSYTFTDKEDRTVLIREMDGTKQHDTHYVYDIKGNLCYVLSPMYQESQDLSLYAYQYSYDNKNRCIMKKMPGGNLNRYAYDKADRLICYQDHYQQQYSKWIISIPDQKGREVIKGVSVSSSINVPPISNTLVYAERYQGEGAMKSGYIIHDLLDMLNSEPKEVNYYDDYSFLSDYESTNTQQSLKYSFEDFPSWLKNKEKVFSALAIEPVGLQSGKRSYLDNNTYLLTALYYDKKGRIVQKRGTNHLGGYDIYFYSYTFTGLTKGQVHIQFDSNKKTIVAEYYNYEYDGGERLKQVIYRLNGGQEIVLAENEYDNLCRLKNVILNNGASTLNYNYNIRNWITSIDSPFFKQKLHYTDGAGSPCYNGNISTITWQAASSGISGYKFSYDDLNRMKDAIYGEGNNLNENSNHFNEQITGYDKNGNILGLKRFGQTSQNDYGLIDDLLLSYTGNRLLAVKDNAVNSAYAGNFEFSNGADKSVEYNYDVSGNLKNDLNKKITDIQYNYLNLPSLIKFENGSNISYLYSPEGAKLRTIHVTDKDTLMTDYCGNVIYENEIPVKLLTEVGYITLTDAVHHYFLQDYQENNRVVIDNNNNVEEVNHYYPFGGVFASTSSVQPFKYNGKELDRKNGLDWYDYGARMYDAALGRFTTSDPSAENYYGSSPYIYCGNNPVTRIDPNGKDWIEDPYGGLLWDVTAISRETTREGWSYIGTTLPEDAGRYRILEEINGKLYHKNTINPLASLVNAIAGEDIMVEKKAYDPVEDHMMQQAIETGAEMAVGEIGGKLIKRGFKALTRSNNSVIKAASENLLNANEVLRIENAATRIGKPINVVGSRASGKATGYSDWDYIIEGLTNKEWKRIKNSLPGAKSIIDNTPRRIDIIKEPLDISRPYIKISPK